MQRNALNVKAFNAQSSKQITERKTGFFPPACCILLLGNQDSDLVCMMEYECFYTKSIASLLPLNIEVESKVGCIKEVGSLSSNYRR